MPTDRPSRQTGSTLADSDRLKGRARRAKNALRLAGGVLFIHAMVSLALVFTAETAALLWTAYDLLGYWYLLVLVATAGLFISWHHSAHRNLRTYGREPRFADAATVYWWFIPVANLIMPYLVVKETVDETKELFPGFVESDPTRLWWALFAGGYVLSLATALTAGGDFAQVELLLGLESAAAMMMAIATRHAVMLVRLVTAIQTGETASL
jgi:hypothetical protein